MKKKTVSPKLRLNKETVRALSPGELVEVAGGLTWSCVCRSFDPDTCRSGTGCGPVLQ
jgi:hypothetical protein